MLSSLVPAASTKNKCAPGPVGVTGIALDGRGVVAIGGEVFRADFGDEGVTLVPAALPGPGRAPAGSARSPNGKNTALALEKSLLVHKDKAIERWRGPDVEGLARCVVNDAGDRIACTKGGSVVVLGPKAR